MERSGRILRGALLFLLLAVAAGCATTPTVGDLARERIAAPGGSLVLGRIYWTESGEERALGVGMVPLVLYPQLVRIEDAHRFTGDLDREGFFAWRLEKGTYIFASIHYREGWSDRLFFSPRVALRVPEDGKIYAIGTLHAEFDAEADPDIASRAARFTVVDTAEDDAETLAKELEGRPVKVEKLLMVREPRLPQRMESLSDFTVATRVLSGK